MRRALLHVFPVYTKKGAPIKAPFVMVEIRNTVSTRIQEFQYIFCRLNIPFLILTFGGFFKLSHGIFIYDEVGW